MTKRLIPADAITCVVAISVQPGDMLLVVNGVCVGVEPRAKIIEHEPAKAKTKKPSQLVIKNRPREKKPTEADVLAVIQKHEPIAAKRIGDELHIPRDSKIRGVISHMLRALISKGRIEQHLDPRGAKQLATYTLKEQTDVTK